MQRYDAFDKEMQPYGTEREAETGISFSRKTIMSLFFPSLLVSWPNIDLAWKQSLNPYRNTAFVSPG